MNNKKLTLGWRFGLIAISIVIILLDQFTKHIARSNLLEFTPKIFLPHWNWLLMYNEGAAFSFLDNQNGWQKIFFTVIASVVSLALIYYILRKCYKLIVGISFSFILGGALGNLIDRIHAGKVTDFIDWYAGTYHWPSFNIADSFITAGVTLLIIETIFFSKSQK